VRTQGEGVQCGYFSDKRDGVSLAADVRSAKNFGFCEICGVPARISGVAPMRTREEGVDFVLTYFMDDSLLRYNENLDIEDQVEMLSSAGNFIEHFSRLFSRWKKEKYSLPTCFK